MKKVINAAAAILCALGVGGGILSCSGGTNYVGTSGSSTTTTPTTTNSEPVADSWNFVTASPDILYDGGTSVANSAKVIVAAGTNTGASDGITYSLANDATIKGADEKLTLTLQSAKVTAGSMSSSAIPVYAYADASGLRIKNNALKISNVVGNVILTVNIKAAGAGSRNLEVTVGTGGTTRTYPSSDIDSHEARFELACGTGSDVYIGASNNYWISAIGVAIDTATFASQTDSSTTNNEATLGLVGTTTSSSDSAVATAAIADGKVAITSKGAGSATITVSNGTGNATIPVTVNTAGAITIGTIVKYSAPPAGGATTYTLLASSQTPTAASEADTDSNKKLTQNREITFESPAPTNITAFCGISNKIESTGFNLGGYLQKAKNYLLLKDLKSGDKLTVKFKTKTEGTAVKAVLAPDGRSVHPVASAGSTVPAYDGVLISSESDSTKTVTSTEFTIASDGDYIFGLNNSGYISEFSVTR